MPALYASATQRNQRVAIWVIEKFYTPVMTAEWRPVTGYEGLYEVSSQGQVRSVSRTVKGREGSDRHIQGKLLTPRTRPDGTLAVNLWKSNAYRQLPVRRLVLSAFDSSRPQGYDAVHVNGDPADNRLQNLQWQLDRRSRSAMRRGAAVGTVLAAASVMLWQAPPAQAVCDYGNRTITCDVRHQPDGSYKLCTFHVKLVGGIEADCVRMCPPLPGSTEPRPMPFGVCQ